MRFSYFWTAQTTLVRYPNNFVYKIHFLALSFFKKHDNFLFIQKSLKVSILGQNALKKYEYFGIFLGIFLIADRMPQTKLGTHKQRITMKTETMASPYESKMDKKNFTTKELALLLRVSPDWLATLRTSSGSMSKETKKEKTEYIKFFKYSGKIFYNIDDIFSMISITNPHFNIKKYNTLDFLLPVEVAHKLHITQSRLSKMRKNPSRFDKKGNLRFDYIEFIKLGKRILYHRKSVEDVFRKIKKLGLEERFCNAKF